MSRYLQSGQRVLNVGIGGGLLEKFCRQIGANVCSIDPDWTSLKSHSSGGYSLIAGKLEALPFADHSFDAVIVSEVFEHLTPEVTRWGLREIERVLNAKGRLIGTVPCEENLSDGVVMCPGCGEVFHKVGHLQSFSTTSLSSLLRTVFPRVNCFKRAFMAKSMAGPVESVVGCVRNFLVLTGLLTREKHIVFIAKKTGALQVIPRSRPIKHRHIVWSRIAFFLPSLAGGGAEKRMLNLSAEFVKKGCAVDIVLAKAEGAYVSSVPAGVRVIDCNASRPIWAIPALSRYLRAERPQALLSTITSANMAAIFASRIASPEIKCVICEASHLSTELRQTSTHNRVLIPLIIRRLYPKAAAIVAVSQRTAEDLARLAGVSRQSIKVIYNPVVSESLLEKSQYPTSHRWLQHNRYPVIVGMGRLTKQKNFATLIRAFALLRARMPSKLIILGEGEERPLLEHLCDSLGIADDVDLPGFEINPYPILSKASLFVLSSLWEGLPWVLVEALACGTKVLSTDCPGGPREILDNGTYGQLCPVENVRLMSEAMMRALRGDYIAVDPKNWLGLFNSESNSAAYLNLLVG